MLTRRIINGVLRIVAHTIARVEVQGLENIPLQGRQIIMFNHVNFVDAPLIAAFWPREVHALTKMENFRSWLLGPFFRLYGAFPVNRGEVDRLALKRATWTLDSDRVLLISPEGTRNRGRGLGKGKDGMTLLAVRTGSPIVPVTILGQMAVVPGLKRLRRMPVKMTVGRPFRFDYVSNGKMDRDAVRQMTSEAMYLLAEMLPPESRGLYSDQSQATRRYIRYLDEEEGVARSTAA